MLCNAGASAGNAANNATGGALHDPLGGLGKSAADSVTTALTKWVIDGANSVMKSVTQLVTSSTEPNLNAAWFLQNYSTMIAIGLPVALLMLLIAGMKSALAGDASIALKAAFAYLPIAMIGTFLAVAVVTGLLHVTDQLTAQVQGHIQTDYDRFALGIGKVLGGDSTVIGGVFVSMIAAAGIVVVGFALFIELVLREAAIYITVLFMPLVFAVTVLPSTANMAKRLIETLVALILSKFIIVAVLAMGVSGLAADAEKGGLKAVLIGIVLLGLAAYSPYKLLMLLPTLETTARAQWYSARMRASSMRSPSSSSVYHSIRRDSTARLAAAGGAAAGAGAVGVGLVGTGRGVSRFTAARAANASVFGAEMAGAAQARGTTGMAGAAVSSGASRTTRPVATGVRGATAATGAGADASGATAPSPLAGSARFQPSPPATPGDVVSGITRAPGAPPIARRPMTGGPPAPNTMPPPPRPPRRPGGRGG